MAYTPTTWADGDIITKEKLNKLEAGVQNEQVGPKGADGKDGAKGEPGTKGADGAPGAKGTDGTNGTNGLGVKAIALTTDATGKVTAGEATMTDDSKVAITVTVAGA